MGLRLVVVRPFGGHARGEVITDETVVSAVLLGEHRLHVVRVAANAKEG